MPAAVGGGLGHGTLIDVAGEPGGAGIDGRSFRSTLLGTGTSVLRPYQVWFSRDQDAAAILEGRWKGVWDGETLELYDLAGDPSETTDVVAAHPEVASRFEAIRRTEDRRLPHPIRRQLPGVR